MQKHKIHFLLILASTQLVGGPVEASLNVFGDDPREEVEATDGRYPYPFEAIGRLNNGCTVSLVGKRLALTAAHCVVDSQSGTVRPDLREVEFNLVKGSAREKVSVTKAWVGTFSPVENRVKDWAVLLLASRVDPQIRRLKLKAVDFAAAKFPYPTSLAGYSGDKHQGKHITAVTECAIKERTNKKDCNGKEVQEGLLFHDCSSTTGISGAPMLSYDGDEALIDSISVSERRKGAVSVFRDEYSCEYANIAIGISQAIPVLNKLLRTADIGLKIPKIEGAFELTPGSGHAGTPTEGNCGLVSPLLSDKEDFRAQKQKIQSLFESNERLTGKVNVDAAGWWPGRCYGELRSYSALLVGEAPFPSAPISTFYLFLHQGENVSFFDAASPETKSETAGLLNDLRPRVTMTHNDSRVISARLLSNYGPTEPSAGEWEVKEISCGSTRYFLGRASKGPVSWCYFNAPEGK